MARSFCDLKMPAAMENLPAVLEDRALVVQTEEEVKDVVVHICVLSKDLGAAGETIILTPFLNGAPHVQPAYDGRPIANGYAVSRKPKKDVTTNAVCNAVHFPQLKPKDKIQFVAQRSDMMIDDLSQRHDYVFDAARFEEAEGVVITIGYVGVIGHMSVTELTTAIMNWASPRLDKGENCSTFADMLYVTAGEI